MGNVSNRYLSILPLTNVKNTATELQIYNPESPIMLHVKLHSAGLNQYNFNHDTVKNICILGMLQ